MPDYGMRTTPQGSLIDALRRRLCKHEWHYDAEESAGPWTGYIERCVRCGALQQVPQ